MHHLDEHFGDLENNIAGEFFNPLIVEIVQLIISQIAKLRSFKIW